MRKGALALLLALGIIAALYFVVKQPRPSQVKIRQAVVNVEVARTKAQLAQGLSGRQSLTPDSGMLFIFSEPGYYGFWMKDMNFPIDIIWISEGKRVVDITSDFSPATYPQTVTSRDAAQYVLEVKSGWAGEHNVNIGDTVSLPNL